MHGKRFVGACPEQFLVGIKKWLDGGVDEVPVSRSIRAVVAIQPSPLLCELPRAAGSRKYRACKPPLMKQSIFFEPSAAPRRQNKHTSLGGGSCTVSVPLLSFFV